MARRKDKNQEDLKIKGFIKCQVTDAKTGKVIGYREVNNLVVNGGRDQFALLAAAGTNPVTHGHVGSSTGSPSATQTDLLASLTGSPNRKAVTTSTAQTGTAQFTWSYETNEFTATNNNVFGEVALFNSSAGGTMFSRATYAQTSKNSSMQISFTYQLRFST